MKQNLPLIDAFLNPKETSDLSSLLFSFKGKLISLSDTRLTLKQFIDWRKSGIIPPSLDTYKEGKRNRIDINLYEYIWLEMMFDLRTLGVSYAVLNRFTDWAWEEISIDKALSLDNLVQITQSLPNSFIDKDKFSSYAENMTDKHKKEILKQFSSIKLYWLEILVMKMFMHNSDAVFAYSFEGSIMVYWSEGISDNEMKDKKISSVEIYQKEMFHKPHISIGLAKYLKDFISDSHKDKFLNPLGLLSEREHELLTVIRRGQIKELIIKFNKQNGGAAEYEIKNDRKISDAEANEIKKILKLKNYESVSYKSIDNSNVYFEKHIKRKFF